MLRVLLGLLKGGIIGGGLGFGFMQLGAMPSFVHYLFYGIIGALVGFVAGKPFWRHETIWTPVVKAIVGFGICLGLYALVVKAFGDPQLAFIGPGVTVSKVPYALGAAVGIVYGIFVEVDDGGKKEADKGKAEAKKKD
ncbi:MAG: hypothetical protein KC503_23360 [Myxococcales bacterium]|nr:hypothetical protein [Myxococcales bacterium]